MSRFLLLLFVVFLTAASEPAAGQDARKIRKEQSAAKKAIKENKRKLETNRREVKDGLRQLRSLEKEIGARDVEIDRLNSEVTVLDNGISATTADIDSLSHELEKLRSGYVLALRRIQSVQIAQSPLGFLFSSSSMNEFFSRLRYLREFSNWRHKREKQIEEASAALGLRKSELAQMKQQQHAAINRLNQNKALLKSRQSQTDNLVVQLRKEGSKMEQEIARRQAQLAKLDRELNRIIEADRLARSKKAREKASAGKSQGRNQKSVRESGNRKAAKPEPRDQMADYDRELTGSFESNRGRLLFPVSGKYRIVRGFGKGQYSDRVQTSHLGVDIEVPCGAPVRAIFDGVVTNVSHLDGFNTIAVIRHGSYLSVYVNLASVSVSPGRKISKGQVFGTVASDDEGRNGLLQFGIRKERQELNPLLWVK